MNHQFTWIIGPRARPLSRCGIKNPVFVRLDVDERACTPSPARCPHADLFHPPSHTLSACTRHHQWALLDRLNCQWALQSRIIWASSYVFATTLKLRVFFSPVPVCVEADCWNQLFQTPRRRPGTRSRYSHAPWE